MTSPPPGLGVILALPVAVERVYTTIMVVERYQSNVGPKSFVVHHSLTRVRGIGVLEAFSGTCTVKRNDRLPYRTFCGENSD
jgi:hypothetical protein